MRYGYSGLRKELQRLEPAWPCVPPPGPHVPPSSKNGFHNFSSGNCQIITTAMLPRVVSISTIEFPFANSCMRCDNGRLATSSWRLAVCFANLARYWSSGKANACLSWITGSDLSGLTSSLDYYRGHTGSWIDADFVRIPSLEMMIQNLILAGQRLPGTFQRTGSWARQTGLGFYDSAATCQTPSNP